MKALILVDIQHDFLPGGALEVKTGNEIFPFVNDIQKEFDLVVATQDWHPENHKSFASNHEGKKPGETIDLNGLEQILWPDHCIQGTNGAEFSHQLHMNKVEAIFRKGTDPEIDSYSGFYDNGHQKKTGLSDYLKGKDVEEVYIVGLAADVCVKFTALDSVRESFKTFVYNQGTRAVNLEPDDFEKALKKMEEEGVNLIE